MYNGRELPKPWQLIELQKRKEASNAMTLLNVSSLLENRITYATLLILFTLAICVNFMAGGSVPAFGSSPALLSDPEPLQNADANRSYQAGIRLLAPPNFADDKAATRIAISPLPPPAPWDEAATRIAISPLPPPAPWDEAATRIAISPLPPPAPWDETQLRIAFRPAVSNEWQTGTIDGSGTRVAWIRRTTA